MTFASITHYVGAWAADFSRILLCTSAFAAAPAFHNAASRYFLALGRQRVLPTVFGRAHRRSGAPVGGTLAQTVVNALVLGLAMVLGADPYLVVFLRSAAPGVLDLLTAAGSAINWALLVPLPVLFLLGVAMALRIRRRDPARYETLGTEDVEG